MQAVVLLAAEGERIVEYGLYDTSVHLTDLLYTAIHPSSQPSQALSLTPLGRRGKLSRLAKLLPMGPPRFERETFNRLRAFVVGPCRTALADILADADETEPSAFSFLCVTIAEATQSEVMRVRDLFDAADEQARARALPLLACVQPCLDAINSLALITRADASAVVILERLTPPVAMQPAAPALPAPARAAPSPSAEPPKRAVPASESREQQQQQQQQHRAAHAQRLSVVRPTEQSKEQAPGGVGQSPRARVQAAQMRAFQHESRAPRVQARTEHRERLSVVRSPEQAAGGAKQEARRTAQRRADSPQAAKLTIVRHTEADAQQTATTAQP
eukprot:m51a1_g7611 hypothetical protein (332) ;mRNA; f:264970-267905